jgi:DNA-3-methyladenine glycosylase II
MGEVIRRVGPCQLRPNRDHFRILVRTIVSQQVSTKAARSILQRLELVAGVSGITAKSIGDVHDGSLRACGLSGGKVRALRDLTHRVLTGALKLDDIAEVPDEEVCERLLPVHGIGPWSVDMFMIFALGRLDVMPVGDLGFRTGVRDLFGLRKMPTPARMEKLCAAWRPYRSIAAWYCWRMRDVPPA